ncbi:MAG: twin-arginine translocase TatA/TatE family subunit [Actinomycetes bacterium]
MFTQVGPLEIVLVAAIALLVLGPKRLPGAARSVGKGIREFRQSVSEAVPSREELDALVDATADEPAKRKDA